MVSAAQVHLLSPMFVCHRRILCCLYASRGVLVCPKSTGMKLAMRIDHVLRRIAFVKYVVNHFASRAGLNHDGGPPR